MKIKHLTFIFLLGLFAYANTLSNGFVADDHQLLLQNTFYRSFDNIPRLFSTESSIKDTGYYTPFLTDKGSINPSFRLIDKISFFFDYASFKLKPWGYHLTNLGIHLLNALVLYLTLCELIPVHLAFYSSVIFCVHPIFAEAVSNISYRGDLLATLFVLLSFYAWINFARDLKLRGYYYGSLLFCLLAFLTKESTAPLPLMILMYQGFFRKGRFALGFQSVFWLLLGWYLYVYFCVYPPTLWIQAKHESSLAALGVVVGVMGEYLKSFFVPGTIDPLPPRHMPHVEHVWASVLVIASAAGAVLYVGRKNKEILFFAGWFLIFYLPVANIIPLINPMAYRFVYLPAIGLCVAAVLIVHQIFQAHFKGVRKSQVPLIISLILTGFLIFQTVGLNSWYRSSRTLSYSWVKYFPQNPWGYFFLGREYFMAGEYPKAKATFEEGFKNGLKDPLALQYWAKCIKK